MFAIYKDVVKCKDYRMLNRGLPCGRAGPTVSWCTSHTVEEDNNKEDNKVYLRLAEKDETKILCDV